MQLRGGGSALELNMPADGQSATTALRHGLRGLRGRGEHPQRVAGHWGVYVVRIENLVSHCVARLEGRGARAERRRTLSDRTAHTFRRAL